MNSKQAAFLSTLVVLLLVSLAGAYVLAPTDEADDGRLRVVATFYPLYYFAQQVGGDRVHVDSLIPFNSEPHSWEPSPADIIKVDKARVFVYNGAGFEPWVGKVLGTIRNRGSMVVVDSSRGIAAMKDTGEQSGINPHFWIDPVLAKQQVENIRAGLTAADPAGADNYTTNAGMLEARLDALDGDFSAGLRNRTRDTIVTTHEGFDYMAGRYNFTADSVLGISPNQEPSAQKIAQIVNVVNEHDLTVVFGEPIYNDRYMQTIANEVKRQSGRDIQVLVLDGLHGLSGPHAGMDYFEIQRENLKNLKIGLGVVEGG